MLDKKSIGKRIEQIKNSSIPPLSYTELGRKLKNKEGLAIPKGTVNSWIRGLSIPSREIVEQLACIGDVTTEWIYTGKETPKFIEWLEFVEDEWFEFKEVIPVCYDLCKVLDPELRAEFVQKIAVLYTNFHYLFNNHGIEAPGGNDKKIFKKDWDRCIKSYSRLLVFEELVHTLKNKEFNIPEEMWMQFRRFKELHLNKEKGYWNNLKSDSGVISESKELEREV